jgi:hypothetical protein
LIPELRLEELVGICCMNKKEIPDSRKYAQKPEGKKESKV